MMMSEMIHSYTMHFPIVPRNSSVIDVLLSRTYRLFFKLKRATSLGEGRREGLRKGGTGAVIKISELIRFQKKAIQPRDRHTSLQGMRFADFQ